MLFSNGIHQERSSCVIHIGNKNRSVVGQMVSWIDIITHMVVPMTPIT